MKVKLLKKIRKRFKWKYLGEVEWMKRMPRLYWEIADSEATQLYKAEHISHMSYGHLIIIDNPTIAEQLTMDIMGIMFVFEHHQHRFAMRNKRFKKKHFNGQNSNSNFYVQQGRFTKRTSKNISS